MAHAQEELVMTPSGTFQPARLDAAPLASALRAAAPVLEAEFELTSFLDPAIQRHARERLVEQVPGLDGLWMQLAQAIREPGAAIVEGFPMDSEVVYAAFGSRLGRIVGRSREGTGQVIVHVTPMTEEEETARGLDTMENGMSRRAFSPHTDHSAAIIPPAIVLLGGVVNETEGGSTTLTPVANVVESMKHDGLEADLRTLGDVVYPTLNAPADSGKPAIVTALLSLQPDGSYRARVRFSAIQAAIAEGAARPDAAHMAVLDEFSEYAANPRLATPFRLEPGRVLIFDNARFLHGRTAFSAEGARDLMRMWVVEPTL